MSRDFSSSVFFIKQLLPVPMGMPRNDFEFFWIFVELFVFVIDSSVMNTPGSRLASLKYCEAIFSNRNHMSRYSESDLQSIFRTILSLKIVVCSLKSVKRLPGVQNDSPVMNIPGSRLRIRITPWKFEKIRNPFSACLTGQWEVVWWKKTRVKNLVTLAH